jgi:hypothetical protein
MNTKIMALAAVTALSLGFGTAMAATTTYSNTQTQVSAPQASAPAARTQETTVQYGSSDHGMMSPSYDTNLTQGGF